jgi:hypothetical protein
MNPRRLEVAVFLTAIVFAAGALGEPRPDREDELDYFPCMDCHEDQTPDPRTRILEEDHEDIELNHGQEGMWCLNCHFIDNRDSLSIYDGGRVVAFNDSPELCGSCHGTIFRDWQNRIHGKTTGYWDRPEPRWLCVECHDPHNPSFKPLAPEPPPTRPRGYRPQRSGHSTSEEEH